MSTPTEPLEYESTEIPCHSEETCWIGKYRLILIRAAILLGVAFFFIGIPVIIGITPFDSASHTALYIATWDQPPIMVGSWNKHYQFDVLDSFAEALLVVFTPPLGGYSCYPSLRFVNASESALLKRYNCILMSRVETSQ